MEKLRQIWAWLQTDRKRLVGTITVLAVSLYAVSSVTNNGGKKQVTYQTKIVTRGTIVSSVSASGQILTSNIIGVDTQATGIVKAIHVKSGDRVYAGQIIATITLDSNGSLASAKAYASLVSAQNAVNVANNNYRSTQATLQNVYDQVKGHDTDETFAQKETRTKAEVANDNAYDAIKLAQANLTAASLSYRQTSSVVITAVGGIIDNITVTPGMVISPGRIAVIKSGDNQLATFNVSEVDVNRVVSGQEATISLDSISAKTLIGKVVTVDKIGVISSGVTNYPVTVSLDTTSTEILPNMAATAKIIIDSKDNVLLVPSEAIRTINDETSSVRVLKDGRPQNVIVKIGLSSDTQTEIISGLSEGDEVITEISSRNSSGNNIQASPFSTFRVGGAAGGPRVRSGER